MGEIGQTETKPIGFDAAAADWDTVLAGRSYTIDDWNRLTFREQQRYGSQECKTKGAIYRTQIKGKILSVTVDLPSSLVGSGFSAKEATWLEDALHKKVEETIHYILIARQAKF